MSWGDRENMDDLNSKMKRQRKAMERMATLRLHVNWVLDLMVGILRKLRPFFLSFSGARKMGKG